MLTFGAGIALLLLRSHGATNPDSSNSALSSAFACDLDLLPKNLENILRFFGGDGAATTAPSRDPSLSESEDEPEALNVSLSDSCIAPTPAVVYFCG